MDIEKRFLDKVAIPDDPDGCWEWQGNKHRQGYGFFKVGDKNMLAHRVSYVMFHEGALTPDIKLLHKCDNPGCVHPLHLSEGTHSDNMQDMVAKGRYVGQRKLTDDQVRAIRNDPRPALTIEKELGMGGGVVSRIKRKLTFKWVTDDE